MIQEFKDLKDFATKLKITTYYDTTTFQIVAISIALSLLHLSNLAKEP